MQFNDGRPARYRSFELPFDDDAILSAEYRQDGSDGLGRRWRVWTAHTSTPADEPPR